MTSGSGLIDMKEYERHLTDRDWDILLLVSRYRVLTDELIAKSFFNGSDTHENVLRVMRRLEKRGLLRRTTCGDDLMYFALTRRSLELLGFEPRTPPACSEQVLPVRLAIAYYCINNGLERKTYPEFAELFPELAPPRLHSSNYVIVETSGGFNLEMLLVDRGGAARRIKSRARRVVAQRRNISQFASLMNGGLFQIRVLTGTPEQQRKIDYQIARESFAPVQVLTTLVPELAHVLTL